MHHCRLGSLSIVATFAFAVQHEAFAAEPQAQQAQQAQQATVLEPTRPSGPARAFGQKAQMAFSSDNGLFISSTNISGHKGSTTTIQLRPSVDYFIMDNLSVGGFLGFDYTNQAGESGHTTALSVGPRVGFDVVLTGVLSVWPKLGLSLSHTTLTGPVTTTTTVNGAPVTTTTDSSTSANSLALNLFLPLMLHPAEHFFVGFGPAFDLDLRGDNKATTIAGRLTLGGWI